jgi:hypothetical protein
MEQSFEVPPRPSLEAKKLYFDEEYRQEVRRARANYHEE